MPADQLGLGEERIAADEDETIRKIVEVNLGTIPENEKPFHRGQHPKPHGIVDARFVVGPDVPEPLRHGLFAQPGEYDAQIRFSNGKQWDDRKGDVHGMAIKIWDVPMPTAPRDAAGRGFLDIILIDSPVFFIADLKRYLAFNQRFAASRRGLLGKLQLVVGILRWGLVGELRDLVDETPTSPLTTTFHSSTPYRLGPHAIKYRASPVASGAVASVDSPDLLHEALRRGLAQGDARFTLGVYRQTDPARHPVEDPTVDWADPELPEADRAPFATVAEIVIKQNADVRKPDVNDERIAFSPGNASEEHRPLGAINRSRVAIYRHMAARRQEESDKAASA